MIATTAAALGLTGCSETWDGNPVLKPHEGNPTVTFLNEPILKDQYIMLSSENREGSLHLTCSQPDYGYAAIVTYKIQVCLDDKFEEGKFIELKPNYYDCSQINPINHEVAGAIEKLMGIESEDQIAEPLPYAPVYFRLRSYISQYENLKENMTEEEATALGSTTYYSNIVSYNKVSCNYYAVWKVGEPADLYLRGGFNDWGTGDAWQFFSAEEENTWVCKDVTINANVSIKVSTASWGSPNLGGNAGENEDSQMIAPDEEIEMTMGDNPGHMRLDVDFTGNVYLSLRDGKYYILFESTTE